MIDPKNYGVHSLEEVLTLIDTDGSSAIRKMIDVNALKYSLNKVIRNSIGETLYDKELFYLLNDLIQRFKIEGIKK